MTWGKTWFQSHSQPQAKNSQLTWLSWLGNLTEWLGNLTSRPVWGIWFSVFGNLTKWVWESDWVGWGIWLSGWGIWLSGFGNLNSGWGIWRNGLAIWLDGFGNLTSGWGIWLVGGQVQSRTSAEPSAPIFATYSSENYVTKLTNPIRHGFFIDEAQKL